MICGLYMISKASNAVSDTRSFMTNAFLSFVFKISFHAHKTHNHVLLAAI
jgi:hypothetical protein